MKENCLQNLVQEKFIWKNLNSQQFWQIVCSQAFQNSRIRYKRDGHHPISIRIH